ncbi:cupin domain-containing protein [Hydrogenispora ethanolica]|uniref:polysaccharide biosynthesis C-terminal domain-containing protein n=1 Tax=Hydrogenispora ethanolica TaxID=1082276 RepID=UPI0014051572|nr:cupin domain-containing protein [Hydrogenispora ethanolica]
MEVFPGTQFGRDDWGLIYLFTMNSGAKRGNHYHLNKNEWFFLAQGEVDLVVRDTHSLEQATKHLSANTPEVVSIPAGVAHALVNTHSETAILIAYIDKEFDPAQPDTYHLEVI